MFNQMTTIMMPKTVRYKVGKVRRFLQRNSIGRVTLWHAIEYMSDEFLKKHDK